MSRAEIGRISSDPKVCGGKPCIAGTRIRVQDIYVWHELRELSVDEIVFRYPHVTMADVYAALAYYWEHRDEIQRQIADDDDFVQGMKEKHGSPLREKLRGSNGAGDSLSS